MARIAYPGDEGAFAHQAALELFQNAHIQGFTSWEEAAQAVAVGTCQYGVFPIYNSNAGEVAETQRILKRYALQIIKEHTLCIKQALLGTAEATLLDIVQVQSHPHALKQCSVFLQKHPEWEIIPSQSTALSAKYVSQQEDKSIAAIASAACAKAYGLRVIANDIQTDEANYTRFIVLQKGV